MASSADRRRPVMTYGGRKRSALVEYEDWNFDDEELVVSTIKEPHTSTPNDHTPVEGASKKSTPATSGNTTPKRTSLKAKSAADKKVDVFDLPSDDEEARYMRLELPNGLKRKAPATPVKSSIPSKRCKSPAPRTEVVPPKESTPSPRKSTRSQATKPVTPTETPPKKLNAGYKERVVTKKSSSLKVTKPSETAMGAAVDSAKHAPALRSAMKPPALLKLLQSMPVMPALVTTSASPKKAVALPTRQRVTINPEPTAVHSQPTPSTPERPRLQKSYSDVSPARERVVSVPKLTSKEAAAWNLFGSPEEEKKSPVKGTESPRSGRKMIGVLGRNPNPASRVALFRTVSNIRGGVSEDQGGEDLSEVVHQQEQPSHSLGGEVVTAESQDRLPDRRVTYARQRSYRAEEPTLGVDSLEALLATPLFAPPKRPAEEELQSEDGECEGQVKSVHELREAGENKRFADEVEYMLEGTVAGNPAKGRRASLIEVGGKLCESSFLLRFKRGGFVGRLLKGVGTEEDVVVGFVLGLTAALTFQDESAAQTVLESCASCIPFLLSLLNEGRDLAVIAKDRKLGLSKIMQESIQELRGKVKESDLCRAMTAQTLVSPRLMGLVALNSLSVLRARVNPTPRELIIQANGVAKLMGILGDNNLDLHSEPVLDVVEMSLKIFELCVDGVVVPVGVKHVERLGILLNRIIAVEEKLEDPLLRKQAELITLSLLRTLISISNGSAICDAMVTTGIVSNLLRFVCVPGVLSNDIKCEDRTAGDAKHDKLLFGLGLMNRLAEESAVLKDKIGQADGFTFAGRSGLEALADQFKDMHAVFDGKGSLGEFDVEYVHAYGYLATLLAHLVQESQETLHAGNLAILRHLLPGNDLSAITSALTMFTGVLTNEEQRNQSLLANVEHICAVLKALDK
ncbi:hypothetical protein YB2330_004327 [Saitoella coloradoensis]